MGCLWNSKIVLPGEQTPQVRRCCRTQFGLCPLKYQIMDINGSETKSEEPLFFLENMTVLTCCFYHDTSTGQARRTLVAGQRPRLRASYPVVKLTLKI